MSASMAGSTNPVVPITTSRSRSGTGAAGLDQLAHDHVALERGQVVDEQDAVEMVELMLDAAGEQAFGFEQPLLAILGQVTDLNRLRAGDIGELAGQAETALLGSGPLARAPEDLGID